MAFELDLGSYLSLSYISYVTTIATTTFIIIFMEIDAIGTQERIGKEYFIW